MTVCWTTLMRHLTRHGYLGPAAPAGSGGRPLGPLGRLLLRNLTALWRRDVELGLNVPVVPAWLPGGGGDGVELPLTEAVSELADIRRHLGLSPPFGLCSEHPVTGQLTPPDQQSADGSQLSASSADSSQLSAPPADSSQLSAPSADGGRLTLLLAVPPAASADWFQTLQRRRRIWWRDLAEDPGNYSLVQASTDGAQVVFDGQLVVERLKSHGQQTIDGPASGNTGCQPHLISCEICLRSALLAVCADALDGGALRLRERLAPYRRAVLCHAAWSEELRALALHVANQLRAAGVSVFPLPSEPPDRGQEAGRSAAEEQDTQSADAPLTAEERWREAALRAADGAGVPLSVLLSESTLSDGVCRLRARDTTLSHQVHVSRLADVS